jgi:hypothetical protein
MNALTRSEQPNARHDVESERIFVVLLAFQPPSATYEMSGNRTGVLLHVIV